MYFRPEPCGVCSLALRSNATRFKYRGLYAAAFTQLLFSISFLDDFFCKYVTDNLRSGSLTLEPIIIYCIVSIAIPTCTICIQIIFILFYFFETKGICMNYLLRFVLHGLEPSVTTWLWLHRLNKNFRKILLIYCFKKCCSGREHMYSGRSILIHLNVLSFINLTN